jgi:hypothetical protein
LLLIDDAKRGLADIVAGSTFEANGAIGKVQQRRGALLQFLNQKNSGLPTAKKRG